VAGFVCLFLLLANVWFVWKETVWFRNCSMLSPPIEQRGPPVLDGPRIA
jgi:hypothetical protein